MTLGLLTGCRDPSGCFFFGIINVPYFIHKKVVFLPDKLLSNTALPCRCPLYVPCFTKERGEPPQGCNEVPLCGTGRHGFAVGNAPPIFFLKHQKENAPCAVEKKKCQG